MNQHKIANKLVNNIKAATPNLDTVKRCDHNSCRLGAASKLKGEEVTLNIHLLSIAFGHRQGSRHPTTRNLLIFLELRTDFIW